MSNLALREPLAILRDLERRSRANAVGLPLQVEIKAVWTGIAFRVDGANLIAPLGEVSEILTLPSLSRVPGTQSWVKGIANVRGNLLPVMDLQGYLGHGRAVPSRRSRVLVINQQGVFAGLVVDEVLGLKHFYDEDRTMDLPMHDESMRPYLKHAFRRGEEHWGVFSMRELAETPQFLRVAL